MTADNIWAIDERFHVIGWLFLYNLWQNYITPNYYRRSG